MRRLESSAGLACAVAAAMLMLFGCAVAEQTGTSESSTAGTKLEKAGKPLDPATTAARVAGVRIAAMTGDQRAVQREMEAMNEEMRRSMKLPDASRPIDREQARSIVRAIEGVRAVAWVDRSNLLVKVDGPQYRNQAMIDRVCIALQPLGDTLATVVNLQDSRARNHDELQTVSRNCQLDGNDRAMFQERREMDVLPESYRSEHAQQQQVRVRAPDRKAIEAALGDTPEM